MTPAALPHLLVLVTFMLGAAPAATLGAGHDLRLGGETPAISEDALDALRALERRPRHLDPTQFRRQVAAHRDELLHDPGSPVGGNRGGDVTVVEFFDYRCGYCIAMAPRLETLLEADHGLRFVYKEWPILGPMSEFAARAALAARRQGRYEDFHSALMRLRGRLTEATVFNAARRLGLDPERLRADMKSPEIDRVLRDNRALAAELGITGTPAFVIGDRLVPGAVPLGELKAVIAAARSAG
ncbi:MAG: DsbA family protein [Dongiaceae bacterium]